MSILGSFAFIGTSDLDLAAGSEGPRLEVGIWFLVLGKTFFI